MFIHVFDLHKDQLADQQFFMTRALRERLLQNIQDEFLIENDSVRENVRHFLDPFLSKASCQTVKDASELQDLLQFLCVLQLDPPADSDSLCSIL